MVQWSLFALALFLLHSSGMLSTRCVGPRSRLTDWVAKRKFCTSGGTEEDTSQGCFRAVLQKSFLCWKAVAKKSTEKINSALESTRHFELVVLVTSCPLPGERVHVYVSLGGRWAGSRSGSKFHPFYHARYCHVGWEASPGTDSQSFLSTQYRHVGLGRSSDQTHLQTLLKPVS